VPVGWLVSDSPITPAVFGAPGDTAVSNTVAGSTATAQAPWRALKDRNDVTAMQNVLSGNSSAVTSPDGLQMASPVYVYFEGDFSYANANEVYATTIYIDLIFQ
jgi:hypothetical protein